MRFTSKAVFIALLTASTATAQVPVGISRFIDPWVDNYALYGGSIQGDNEMVTAWAANSMLPLFPDPTGLPVFGILNDTTAGSCGGNLEIFQVSKLAPIGVVATTANHALTMLQCMTSYGAAPGDATAPGGTWNDSYSWKGTVMAFRNGRLLAPFYRQAPAGNAFGDSSMVISPDAGQTWIDYGRYNGYTVTAASCAGTTVTLTATNTLPAGQKIYVHDVGAVYDGKQTIATASGSQVTYTVSGCTGATGSTGYFGILSADGSAPLGPLDSRYNTMWRASAGEHLMGTQSIISYGQDGNYPAGIESACDPTAYVCGIAMDNPPGTTAVILWRVPVGKEMDKAQYQWYTCAGYNVYWAVPESVCDGSHPANWTSTMSGATNLFYTFASATRPGQIFMMKYLPSHKSYLTANVARTVTGSRLSFYWAPHPWGPFYPVTNSECSERDANYPQGCVPFFSLMDYGENIVSVDPPTTQIRLASKSDDTSEGLPSFWTVEAATGRVPFTGAARRADYMGISGQLGIGHRFVSGNEAGSISRRGSGINGVYSLYWWTDFWDHGGATTNGATSRPWFRDAISGGAKHFDPMYTDAGDGVGFGKGLSLQMEGPKVIYSGYTDRVQSSFTDSTVFPGNSSWTYITTFKVTDANTGSGGGVYNNSNAPVTLLYAGGSHASNVSLEIGAARDWNGTDSGDGNIFVAWGDYTGSTSPTFFHTASNLILPNVWYFLAVTAKASGSGFPIVTVYLGNAGALAEYGGGDLSTSVNNSVSNGLTKTCGTNCAATPNVNSSQLIYLGGQGGAAVLNGILGDTGAYSGVVPSHVIREIYRTLRTDWARVGRGAI
jgi:hypothetical protein